MILGKKKKKVKKKKGKSFTMGGALADLPQAPKVGRGKEMTSKQKDHFNLQGKGP